MREPLVLLPGPYVFEGREQRVELATPSQRAEQGRGDPRLRRFEERLVPGPSPLPDTLALKPMDAAGSLPEPPPPRAATVSADAVV